MLLLNINGKPYMGVQLHCQIWPWVILKGQTQGYQNFEALYLVKEPN